MASYVGTSGWSYDEWVGAVYPNRATPKLKFYSTIFNTVEIDSTFYAYPSKEMVSGWVRNTPQGFRFSVKLPKIITHEKKLKNVEPDLMQFIDLIRPLSDFHKLGAILIQMPPSFIVQSFDSLERFFQILPEGFSFAVEFRDASWEDNKVYDLLERYKVSSVITDSPLELKTKLTTDWTFVRYHGRGKKIWYDYKYSADQIKNLAKKLEKIQNETTLVYEYFNNHYGGNAVENALQMIQVTGSLTSKQLEALNRFGKPPGLDSFL